MMNHGKLPFTRKMIEGWGGPITFQDGCILLQRGMVLEAKFEQPIISGTLAWGSRTIKSSAKLLPDGSVDNLCPCRDNVERGMICAHVIALALTLLARHTDPERDRKLHEEERRARHLKTVESKAFFKRGDAETPGAKRAKIRLGLTAGWHRGVLDGKIGIKIFFEMDGMLRPISEVSTDTPLILSEKDEAILFVLEEISEGTVPHQLTLHPADFINVLELNIGGAFYEEDGNELKVNAARMSARLRIDLDHENGELLLVAHSELPFVRVGDFPLYILSGKKGWVFGGENFWPLERLFPKPLWDVYRQQVVIPREDIPRFLRAELPQLEAMTPLEAEVAPDVFIIEPEIPQFRLHIRGSRASLAISLQAIYGDIELPAGKPDVRGLFSHPDATDILRYTVRNLPAEEEALQHLARYGIKGSNGDSLPSIVGIREVTNFIGGVAPILRRRGWRMEWSGKIEAVMEEAAYVTPVVRIQQPSSEQNWFEVQFEFDDGMGESISAADIQRALLKGDSYIEHGEKTILLDSNALQALKSVFEDCASSEGSKPGSFRLASVYTAYAASALQAMDGIDVEAPTDWLRQAEEQNQLVGVDEVRIDPSLNRLLRPYQKEGVRWLQFLSANRFGGILADEMGLGKTVQTLAWLASAAVQQKPEERKPTLIVCPTSLVDNWTAESSRFTPWLKIAGMSGAERHSRWNELGAMDIVVTSYALMRRDVDLYAAMDFSAIVLDEAQHIKNRSTQNALAAKRLRADHRVVLTGTPIENGVSDLWSIMDFLMPGYLGTHECFKTHYEQPIFQGGVEGELAHWKLRKKLRPFLLRRMKKDVAKDLPPKIERIAGCTLSADQKKVYAAILENSQQKIADLVARQGFKRSKMEILNILLRLRQICCHLDLLKLDGINAKEPSSKMELFFELLDEAMDAGHRVLVFSQFVSMLTILRQEMARRNIRYCYLDGSTQERFKIVQEFNLDASIPVFLISLKAGGTGLNLTGADMVIHYDPWWNPAVENQATDRAYRIGQKRTVYSIKLIAQDSVEERVLALQRRKQFLYDATLSNDDDRAVMDSLTWDDIQELLSI